LLLANINRSLLTDIRNLTLSLSFGHYDVLAVGGLRTDHLAAKCCRKLFGVHGSYGSGYGRSLVLLLLSSRLHLLLPMQLLLRLQLLLMLYLLLIVALGDFKDFDPVLGRQQLVEDCSLIGVGIHEREVPSLRALPDCALKDTLGGCLVLGDIVALEDFPLLVGLLQDMSLLLLLLRGRCLLER
jgi:hypothetical protein